MLILDVNKLGKDFGYGVLFENVSFSLNEGESVAIVGPNGCGKSTLLKLIAGLERTNKGSINLKKDCVIGYLDQVIADLNDHRLVKDVIRDVFKDLNELEEKIKKYSELIDDEKSLNKYCNLVEEFTRKGGYDIDVKINTVCSGLKISKELLEQEYSVLSGGEKTLVQLAKVLLKKPDLLLLDEPTNHLDIERIEWLEKYIKSFKGACIIVSHDRYFLNKMANMVLDLSNEEAKLYYANYDGYLKEKERDFEKQMASYKEQQLLIKRLKEQIKYYSERGMATNSSTLCDRAHVLQTRLNKILENAVKRPQEKKDIIVDFSLQDKSSKVVFKVEDLTIKVENKIILDKINLTISSKEKVAFIGSNGSGKSTLVKALIGEQTLQVEGNIVRGPSVKIGYLPQVINFETDKKKVLDYFKESTYLDEQRARGILASFQFYKDDVNKMVKNLSGGERIRLKLAILLQNKVNCLVFDEPTNHIDINTKEVLEKALEDYDGTFIFVSHDRYFINKFADRLYEFSDGKITKYEGNYENYKEKKM